MTTANRLRHSFIAAGALVLSACATAPLPPTEALQAAENAIVAAEKARVADYAMPELGEARANLAAARTAVQKNQMLAAQRYAEKSRAGAELATANAEVIKAKAINDEMLKSTEALKQEMNRNSGAK